MHVKVGLCIEIKIILFIFVLLRWQSDPVIFCVCIDITVSSKCNYFIYNMCSPLTLKAESAHFLCR